ncbi:MAG: dockerin type I repeat-containing protein [Clostridia bacterium]|nr:dockerin type I repeat-containing protein [Clostridia bacterium]
MKKIISVLLVISMLFSLCAVNAFAAVNSNTAKFTFSASVLNASSSGQAQDKKDYLNTTDKTVYNSTDGKTITVYPGQVVWVTMHLETGSKYYAGDLQAYVFYTTNIFKSTDQNNGCYIWDTEGKYSGVCARTGAPFSKMVTEAINITYPENWSESQRAAYGFYSVIMYPNPNVTTTVQSSINDDLVTFPVYVKADAKAGDKGSIYIPVETVTSDDNPSGRFMLSNYADKGNTLSQNIPHSKDQTIDLSEAKLNFVVGGKSNTYGDVNSDSKINSSDALLVLQSSTGVVSLSSKQKEQADVNRDSKINASDALLILQYATGIVTK